MVTSSAMTRQEIETAIKVVELEIIKTKDLLRALELIKSNLMRTNVEARHEAPTPT